MTPPTEPRIVRGAIHADERGEVGFVNDFEFRDVRRFYTIASRRAGTVRAWHGHKVEAKYVFVTRGEILVGCVAVDDWTNPSPDLHVHRFVLTENAPAILWVPPGFANGLMSLTDESKAVVFSTATLAESQADDFRFPARFWNPWSNSER